MEMATDRTEKLIKIVELVNTSEISSIKQIVTEILRLINDDESCAKDLKDLIEKDPPLCAKLLKRANSAYYGYPRTICDIQEAIVCMGFDAVRELSLNQKVCDLFARQDCLNGYSRVSLWKNSLAVAICCKMIFRRELQLRGDNIYVAGLLHNLGIIVEDQFFQEQFKQALALLVEDEKNLHFHETELMLVNHAEIGWAIAVNWNFPEELSTAIKLHHQPDLVEEEFKKFVYTVFVADYACQKEQIGYADAPHRDVTMFHKCLQELNIKEKAIEIIVEEVKIEIKKMEEMENL